MSDISQANTEPAAQPEYQAGAECAVHEGVAISDLVAELQSAASIVEGAGQGELANKLRNWAICIAGVLSAHSQSDWGPEVFVG